ncbi:MAG: endonuclease/exonuclease/phosphatase family protein [Pseudobdellovibrionaceae bacterium]|nr:endonuclease/exonuclease/phosphatase family protein [Pseudobdellovibrionaceae bacterium]
MNIRSEPIKILSYNLHLGLSAFRKRAIEERLIQTILREQCDIVMLQELWIPEDAVILSFLDHLQEELEHRICGPTVKFATGIQGNGLLSCFPIVKWRNQTLLESSKNQPRAILHADVQMDDGGQLALICTHFGLTHRERLEHARELAEYIHEHVPRETPLIVAGDFNDWPCKLSRFFLRELGLAEIFKSTLGRHQRTFPAILPMFCLDRIYARGFTVQDARVVHEAGWFGSSDHLPLAATLLLQAAPSVSPHALESFSPIPDPSRSPDRKVPGFPGDGR